MHCTSEYCHYDSNTYISEQIFEQIEYFALALNSIIMDESI